MSARSPRGPYLILLTAVVVLDQITKWLVDRSMDLHDSRVVVEGLISLTYVQNRGAAFGVFSDAQLPYQSLLFSLVSVAALCGIAAYAWRLPAASRLPQTALALIMGGAVGNLVDRARLGHVVDFVDVYWKSHHWPAFNVADSAITVGVCLLILDMVLSPEAGENTAAEACLAPGAERVDAPAALHDSRFRAPGPVGGSPGPARLRDPARHRDAHRPVDRHAPGAQGGPPVRDHHRHGGLRDHRGPDRGQGPARGRGMVPLQPQPPRPLLAVPERRGLLRRAARRHTRGLLVRAAPSARRVEDRGRPGPGGGGGPGHRAAGLLHGRLLLWPARGRSLGDDLPRRLRQPQRGHAAGHPAAPHAALRVARVLPDPRHPALDVAAQAVPRPDRARLRLPLCRGPVHRRDVPRRHGARLRARGRLSTSQFIAVLMVVAAALILPYLWRRKRLDPPAAA